MAFFHQNIKNGAKKRKKHPRISGIGFPSVQSRHSGSDIEVWEKEGQKSACKSPYYAHSTPKVKLRMGDQNVYAATRTIKARRKKNGGGGDTAKKPGRSESGLLSMTERHPQPTKRGSYVTVRARNASERNSGKSAREGTKDRKAHGWTRRQKLTERHRRRGEESLGKTG